MMERLEQANIDCNEGYPGSELIVREGWAQLVSPLGKASAMNAVYRSILSDDEADRMIDETFAFYRQLQVPFRWVVTPSSRPRDLAGRLIARGMKLLYEASAMFVRSQDAVGLSQDGGIEIRELGLSEIDLYIDTFMTCWGLPGELRNEIYLGVRHALEDSNRQFRPFAAFGEPNEVGVRRAIGTAALILLDDGAYLAAGTVHPEFRGQGVYRALLAARARLALELGREHLYIHAKVATAAPICSRLGFETVYTHQVYVLEA